MMIDLKVEWWWWCFGIKQVVYLVVVDSCLNLSANIHMNFYPLLQGQLKYSRAIARHVWFLVLVLLSPSLTCFHGSSGVSASGTATHMTRPGSLVCSQRPGCPPSPSTWPDSGNSYTLSWQISYLLGDIIILCGLFIDCSQKPINQVNYYEGSTFMLQLNTI